jgi:TRAP-type C4-dicarboxylate transport system substrate-binding protein
MKTLNLKWIIAHQPVYLFQRVAEDFKRLVNERSTDVQIDIEILTDEEYNAKYQPTEPATRHNLWKFLQDNTVQIAQMQTTSLARQANQQMHVLSMPYLFEDHDHAAEILEGSVGQKLLNSFDANSKLKGLAYTYSGGFMMFPVKGSVTSLADIAGQQVRSRMSHVSQETLKAFGMIPVPTEIDEVSEVIQAGEVVAAEHVAQRLLPDNCDSWVKTIIDTQHSLFLTSIVVNVDWWNNLDAKVQNIFTEAALQAARNERALSLEDGAASLKTLEQNGVTVINLDRRELDVLRQKAEVVYEKYQDYFDPGLVDSIRKTK